MEKSKAAGSSCPDHLTQYRGCGQCWNAKVTLVRICSPRFPHGSTLTHTAASLASPLEYPMSISNVRGSKQNPHLALTLLVLSLIPFSRYHPCVSVIQAKILGTTLDLVAVLAFHKPLWSTFAPTVFLDQILGTVSPLAATVETTSSLPLIHFKSSISSFTSTGPCSTKQPE